MDLTEQQLRRLAELESRTEPVTGFERGELIALQRTAHGRELIRVEQVLNREVHASFGSSYLTGIEAARTYGGA